MTFLRPFLFSAVAMCTVNLFFTDSALALEVGDTVDPAGIEVPNEKGEMVQLAEQLKEGYTLVYFYPKALTPG